MQKLISTTATGAEIKGKATGSFLYIQPQKTNKLKIVALKSQNGTEFILIDVEWELIKAGDANGSGFIIATLLKHNDTDKVTTVILMTTTWTGALFHAELGDVRQKTVSFFYSS